MMFVRTGRNEYSLAVVVTEPANGVVACISVEAILSLLEPGREITMNPAADFRNGYDAGVVDCTPEQARRIARWLNNGQFITLTVNANGGYRFGRVNRSQLHLTEAQENWLVAWCDSMEYERIRRQQSEQAKQPAKITVIPTEPKPAKPKIKRKQRREVELYGEYEL